MRASVLTKKGEISYTEKYPMPEIDAEEVLIQVEACGLCATDVKMFKGEYSGRLPVISGHEFVGKVVRTGNDVKNICVGDRVVVDPNESCCCCKDCHSAHSTYCSDMAAYGVLSDGGFAEYTKAKERGAYRIPRDMPAEQACFVEPVSCAVHGLDRAAIKAGDIVVIVGAGTMGQILLQLVKNSGASKIIHVDMLAWKLEISKEHGATNIIDASRENVYDKIMEFTDGRGANVVFEAVGNTRVFETALTYTAKGATFVQFGFAAEGASASIIPFDILSKELTIVGSWLNPYTFDRTIQLLASGAVKVDHLISDRLSIRDLEKGIKKAIERPVGFMKAVILPVIAQ